VSRLRGLVLPIDVSNHLHPHLITLPGDEFFRLPRALMQLVRLIPGRLALRLRLLTDENQRDCRFNPRQSVDHRHPVFRMLLFVPRQPLDKLGQQFEVRLC